MDSGEFKKRHNDDILELYESPDIVQTQSRIGFGLVVYAVKMGKKGTSFRALIVT